MIIFDYPYYRHTASNNRPDLNKGLPLDEHRLMNYKKGDKIKIVELAEGDVPGPSSTHENITVFDKIHEMLKKYKIDPADVEMVLGSFNFDKLYKEWASKPHVQEELIGKRNSYGFYFLQEQKRFDDKVEFNDERSKHFICLNGAVKPKRLKFVKFCKNHGLMDNYISLVGNYNTTGKKFEPIILDKDSQQLSLQDKIVPDVMHDAYLNIINETHEDETVFMTEKTWKPILNYQLFLYYGVGKPKEYYDVLLDNGFKLYDEIFNYNNSVEHEIYRFCTTPIKEVKEKFKAVKDKLIYNRQRALEIEPYEV
jgi:hypothetical protein